MPSPLNPPKGKTDNEAVDRAMPKSERPYAQLTPEESDQQGQDMKLMRAQGVLQPKLEPSLLGLEQGPLSMKKFPASHDLSFFNPPEFVMIAFSALDAYAAAVLAAPLHFDSLGALDLVCSLKRQNLSSPMHLEFRTRAERGLLEPPTDPEAFVDSFAAVLRARNIDQEPTIYTLATDYFVELAYPGRMIPEVSPFLRNRVVELWPEATLRLVPTEDLKRRARGLMTLLQMPTDGGEPN